MKLQTVNKMLHCLLELQNSVINETVLCDRPPCVAQRAVLFSGGSANQRTTNF